MRSTRRLPSFDEAFQFQPSGRLASRKQAMAETTAATEDSPVYTFPSAAQPDISIFVIALQS